MAAALAKFTPAAAAQETGVPAERIERVAREFAAAKPSLAVAGGVGAQHAGATELCAAVNLLNFVAGNVGQTVRFGAELAAGDGYAALAQLAAAMDGGQVAVLLVHDANPVYALPKAARLRRQAARRCRFKVSTSLFLDETAAQCDLLLPQHHALERWDDLAPRAGVRSLMQPVMEPVFDTRCRGRHPAARRQEGRRRARRSSPMPSWEAQLRSRWQALAAEREGGRGRTSSGARPCSAAASSTSRRAPASVALARERGGHRVHQAGVRGQRETSSSSPTRTACCTTAAGPTSRGCSRMPTPSPRSPGTPGSR